MINKHVHEQQLQETNYMISERGKLEDQGVYVRTRMYTNENSRKQGAWTPQYSTCGARCAHRKSRPLKRTHTCITCIRTCSGPRGNSWVHPDETHPSWNVIFMPRGIYNDESAAINILNVCLDLHLDRWWFVQLDV